MHRVGKLELHPKDNIDINHIQKTKKFNIDLLIFNQLEIEKHFPYFNVDDNYIGLYEPQSGYLDIENIQQTILNNLDRRISKFEHEKVEDWYEEGKQIIVKTDKAVYKTKSLLITAGSWFELLKEHDLPLQKIHKELCWYDVNKSFGESTYTMPVFGLI